ncbi:small ribosomal subunit protein mS22-like [Montipora foliosa]|uniref:small ribosomal subunit protein mS22-like n=1 Tax=Montipora foliosa TaxID=591990 RepID=UPI0035F16B9D
MATMCRLCYHRCHFKAPLRLLVSRTLCTNENLNGSSNIPSFDSKEVRSILKRITGRNLDKIFSARKQKLGVPSYKLMTDAEFLMAQEEVNKKAEHLLEMPPVMDERQEINEILGQNDELANYSESRYIFTDISTSACDRTRSITIREPDGKLRKATWEERDRMNLIYFPKPGRRHQMPELLKDENLQGVFQQNLHEDILDLASVQFEPDSADYIRVHQRTYEDIVVTKKFDLLRSTRHFGGLVYYLAKKQRIMELLEDMMARDLWDDCLEVVKLHHLVNPYSTIADQATRNNLKGFSLLRAYIRRHGSPQTMETLEEYLSYNEKSQNVN